MHWVYLRGMFIVFWVTLNVHNIAMGMYIAAFVSGTVVSVIWWFNARLANRTDSPWGALAYGLGAGSGTVAGIWLGNYLT